MEQLQKTSPIRPENLQKEAYLESLLAEGERTGILSSAEADEIRYNLLELLASRLEHLYGKTTSSVPDEWASDLFDCLLYTMGAWLQISPTPEAALDSLRNTSTAFLYQKGLRLMHLFLADIRRMAEEIYATRVPCRNGFYQSAVTRELPGFLASCRPEKNAHQHGSSIFYTPAYMEKGISGVWYMRQYAAALLLENRFCSLFPEEDLQTVLDTPDGRTGNIFLAVLSQVSLNLLAKGIPSCAPVPAEALASLPRTEGELLARLYTAFGNANSYLRACLPSIAKELTMYR